MKLRFDGTAAPTTCSARRARATVMSRIRKGSPGAAWPAGAPLQRCRQWQLSRPFWGALLMIIAGAKLLGAMRRGRAVRLTAAAGLSGPVQPPLASALVGCGLLTWFHPVQRSVYATAAILLATAALMTSDVGRHLMGTLIGAAGGSIAVAWVPTGRQPAG